MKTKEIKELVSKTTADLNKQLRELHSDFASTRLDLQMGKSKNTAILKGIKKDIARVMTVLNQKVKEETKG
jgi:ribosomal protein L29